MADENHEIETKNKMFLRTLSVQDFRDFGLHQIAYIRKIERAGETGYSICAADGEEITVMETRDQAIMATRHNDLEPVTLH